MYVEQGPPGLQRNQHLGSANVKSLLKKMPRPALLQVDHPLAYSYVKPVGDHLHRIQLSTIKDQVHYLFEPQNITDLLNNYAYTLDVCMVDSSAADRWAALFTDDCNVTYPFGTHAGTKELADWCLNAELRFHRMMASVRSVQVPAALDAVALDALPNVFLLGSKH